MSSGQFAVIFPGQGSQKVGMLAALAEAYPIVEETFAQASEVLAYDLWQLCQAGPQEAMNLTEKTQPLLLTSSVALWRIWESQTAARPKFMAGHSLGEFSALVCSGVIEFEAAVDLVRQRGRFMQSAVPVGVGAMAAIIGMEDEVIVNICAEISAVPPSDSEGKVVQAVNFNSPGQVVIAGHADAVERAIEACQAGGAKRAMPLPVSAPFHTSLMKPAGVALAEVISSIAFSDPAIPIVHNVHAELEPNPERIKNLMVEQISSPVQWSKCVQFMAANDVVSMVECGPGKVLSGLVRRIDKSLNVSATEDPAGLEKALESV